MNYAIKICLDSEKCIGLPVDYIFFHPSPERSLQEGFWIDGVSPEATNRMKAAALMSDLVAAFPNEQHEALHQIIAASMKSAQEMLPVGMTCMLVRSRA